MNFMQRQKHRVSSDRHQQASSCLECGFSALRKI